MKKLLFLLLILPLTGGLLAQDIPPKDWQIETALMAVPSDYREGAAVYGYDASGAFTKLREGTNDYIALADDPTRENFSTAAYHKDLDPFMARGRELKAEGKSGDEIFEIREAEVRAGTLALPDKTTLCVFNRKGESADQGNRRSRMCAMCFICLLPPGNQRVSRPLQRLRDMPGL